MWSSIREIPEWLLNRHCLFLQLLLKDIILKETIMVKREGKNGEVASWNSCYGIITEGGPMATCLLGKSQSRPSLLLLLQPDGNNYFSQGIEEPNSTGRKVLRARIILRVKRQFQSYSTHLCNTLHFPSTFLWRANCHLDFVKGLHK